MKQLLLLAVLVAANAVLAAGPVKVYTSNCEDGLLCAANLLLNNDTTGSEYVVAGFEISSNGSDLKVGNITKESVQNNTAFSYLTFTKGLVDKLEDALLAANCEIRSDLIGRTIGTAAESVLKSCTDPKQDTCSASSTVFQCGKNITDPAIEYQWDEIIELDKALKFDNDGSNFDILAHLLRYTQMDTSILSVSNVTIFAPTDAAFARITNYLTMYRGDIVGERSLFNTLVDSFSNGTEIGGTTIAAIQALRFMLSYHILGGESSSEQFKESPTLLATSAGVSLFSGMNELVDLSPSTPNAEVLIGDINVVNNVTIHAINSVLLPFEVKFNLESMFKCDLKPTPTPSPSPVHPTPTPTSSTSATSRPSSSATPTPSSSTSVIPISATPTASPNILSANQIPPSRTPSPSISSTASVKPSTSMTPSSSMAAPTTVSTNLSAETSMEPSTPDKSTPEPTKEGISDLFESGSGTEESPEPSRTPETEAKEEYSQPPSETMEIPTISQGPSPELGIAEVKPSVSVEPSKASDIDTPNAPSPEHSMESEGAEPSFEAKTPTISQEASIEPTSTPDGILEKQSSPGTSTPEPTKGGISDLFESGSDTEESPEPSRTPETEAKEEYSQPPSETMEIPTISQGPSPELGIAEVKPSVSVEPSKASDIDTREAPSPEHSMESEEAEPSFEAKTPTISQESSSELAIAGVNPSIEPSKESDISTPNVPFPEHSMEIEEAEPSLDVGTPTVEPSMSPESTQEEESPGLNRLGNNLSDYITIFTPELSISETPSPSFDGIIEAQSNGQSAVVGVEDSDTDEFDFGLENSSPTPSPSPIESADALVAPLS